MLILLLLLLLLAGVAFVVDGAGAAFAGGGVFVEEFASNLKPPVEFEAVVPPELGAVVLLVASARKPKLPLGAAGAGAPPDTPKALVAAGAGAPPKKPNEPVVAAAAGLLLLLLFLVKENPGVVEVPAPAVEEVAVFSSLLAATVGRLLNENLEDPVVVPAARLTVPNALPPLLLSGLELVIDLLLTVTRRRFCMTSCGAASNLPTEGPGVFDRCGSP